MLYTNHNTNLSHRHDVSDTRYTPGDLVALSVLDIDEQLVCFDAVAATPAELIAAWHPWIICYLLDEDTAPSRPGEYDEVVDAGLSGEIDNEAVVNRMIQMAEDDNEHLLIHYRRYHATQTG